MCTDATPKPIRRRRQAILSTFRQAAELKFTNVFNENQNIHKLQQTIPVQILGLNIFSQQNQFTALHESIQWLSFIITSYSQRITRCIWQLIHGLFDINGWLQLMLTNTLLLTYNKATFDIHYDSLLENMSIWNARHVKHFSEGSKWMYIS